MFRVGNIVKNKIAENSCKTDLVTADVKNSH